MADRRFVARVGLALLLLGGGGVSLAVSASEPLGPFREVDPSLKRARELSAEGRLVDAVRAVEAEPALLKRPDALLLRAECVIQLIESLDPAMSSRDGRSVGLRPLDDAEVRHLAVPLLVPGEPVWDRRQHDWQWFREGYQAIDDCRAITAADPTDARAHWILAGLLASAGEKPEQTAEVLNEAIRLAPDDIDIRLSRVTYLAISRKLSEAWTDLRSAEKQFPEDWRIVRRRSDLCLRQNDPVQCLFDAERAFELAPDPASIRGARRQLIAAKLVNDQREEAIALIDVQLADARIVGDVRQMDHRYYLSWRGTANLKLGRYGEALADLDREAALDPDAPNLHARRAAVYHAMGRFDECAEECRLATRPCPYSLSTHKLYLGALEQTGDVAARLREAEFVEWLETWATVRNCFALYPRKPSWYLAAVQHLQKAGLTAESVEYCDRAIAVGDETGTGYRLRAKARLAAGDAEAALADADRAVADGAAAEGGDLEARAMRADVYLALGRLAEAADDYEAAGAFGEAAARALRGRADAREAAGRAEEAAEDRRKADLMTAGGGPLPAVGPDVR